MKYNPNFNDPRVRSRVTKALKFVNRVFLKRNAIIMLSKETLDNPENFGHSGHMLSKYLRGVLLECTDHFYNPLTDTSKKYKLNKIGERYLNEVLEKKTTLDWRSYKEEFDLNNNESQCLYNSVTHLKVIDEVFDQYKDEIESGNFVMKKIGTREYHRLQQIPSDIRKVKFAQQVYVHEYDIETAAPSLLLQRAKRDGLMTPSPVIEYFLENKVLIRNLVAQDCGIDYQQAKQVITALFQGAKLSTYKDNRIYRDTLNYNTHAMQALQSHAMIIAIKQEIKEMWKVLSKNFVRETYVRSNGVSCIKPVSGKQKSDLYFEVEEEVMKSVKKFLKKDKGIRFITEHDGWRTDRVIDLDELRSCVRRMTGYMIKVDYTNCSS